MRIFEMTTHENIHHNLEIPSVSEIEGAYGETLKHNEIHASQKAAFGALLRAMTRSVETTGEIHVIKEPQEAVQDAITEGEIDAVVLNMMNENLFAKIGIKMFPSGSNHIVSTMYSLKPHLIPYASGAYAEFLAQIETPESSTIHSLLTDVDESTYREIKIILNDESLFDSKEDQEIVIANRLQEFELAMSEYQRIGIEPKTAELVKRWGENVLQEYFAAKQMDLLTDYPKVWHLDNTKYSWKDAIPFIAGLEAEERTKSFADELKTHLSEVIDRSIHDLDTVESQNYAKGARPSLVEIGKFLRDDEYDAAVIMDRWEKQAY